MYGRLDREVLHSAGVTADEFDDLVASISTVDSLRSEVAYLRSVSKYVRELTAPSQLIKKKSDRVSLPDAA